MQTQIKVENSEEWLPRSGMNSEQRLCAAILRRVYFDLYLTENRIAQCAHAYLRSCRTGPWSFAWVAEQLGWPAHRVRNVMLNRRPGRLD